MFKETANSTLLLPLALSLGYAFHPASAFYMGGGPTSSAPLPCAAPLRALDPDIAAQFTMTVCTSTSCSRKLKDQGLDQYHVLGEIYALAQEANVHECVIIEDGACRGGRNCKLGPCVAISHEDFVGNVALEGMNSGEMQARVFHDVSSTEQTQRVWGCMENAINLMAEEQ